MQDFLRIKHVIQLIAVLLLISILLTVSSAGSAFEKSVQGHRTNKEKYEDISVFLVFFLC